MGNIKTPYDRVFIKTDEEITLPEKQALIGRLEKFLYAICAFDFDDLPIPQSRIEKFVFALISDEIPDIVPQSRVEKFLLAYLTGDTSDLPEPQSRIELLLNNLVFGIQDISNVETIQSRYELLMAYLVQHNEGSNVEPTYHTLTIKYVDVNGNELHERYVEENIKIGTIYDVSHLDDEIEIEDYQYVRTDGDKTTGVMTKDREIIVVYKLKEYDLTIKYQDENGNTIHTSYTETLEKGTSYDVSHLDDEIEIEGYVYLRSDGDSLTGIMDGNKEIIVIYETVVIDIFYNLTIKYVDTNGAEIFNKYEIESIKEGLNYDVSHLDNEIVIDGYKYVKTEGDSLIGIMDENKEITVVYKKLENYNLIIKYQDEDGNTLIDDYKEIIQEDNFYDVSHLDDEVLINGYTYLSVKGDSLSGVMDGNKEIIVVYEINYKYALYDFSEENYTLYNTVEKPVKSAILSGNTLVNYAQITEYDFNNGRIIVHDLLKPLEIGKTYTIIMNIVSQTVTTGITTRFAKAQSNYTGIKTFNGLGLHKISFISSIEFNQFAPYINREEYESGLRASYNQLMILEGDYTNIDIPFFEGMQSVKLPVLTTSNEDNTKSITVTCNEEVELRGVGDVKDELDLLTGELTRRIDESGNILSQEITESIDLSIVDQDGNEAELSSFEDITYVTVTPEGLLPDVKLEVATKIEEVLNTMSLEMNDISTTQTTLEETSNTQSENIDSTMIATTEIYEGLL